MKIRQGFVSNSSSSSFVLVGFEIDVGYSKRMDIVSCLLHYVDDLSEKPLEYDGETLIIDEPEDEEAEWSEDVVIEAFYEHIEGTYAEWDQNNDIFFIGNPYGVSDNCGYAITDLPQLEKDKQFAQKLLDYIGKRNPELVKDVEIKLYGGTIPS